MSDEVNGRRTMLSMPPASVHARLRGLLVHAHVQLRIAACWPRLSMLKYASKYIESRVLL